MLSLFFAVTAAAADPLYQWDPKLDTAWTVATGTTWATLWFGVEPSLGPSIPHGSAPQGIDRVSLGRWSPGVAKASDLALYTALPAAVGLSAWAGHEQGSSAIPALLVIQSVTTTGAIVDLAKLAVRRPRPFTWTENPSPEIAVATQKTDAWMSFPSGHTAFVGAVSFSTAEILVHSRGIAPWKAYGTAGLLTAGMGSLRVFAGKHYPTDVLVGGVIGAAVGLGTVALHEKKTGEASTSLSLGAGASPAMLTVSGEW